MAKITGPPANLPHRVTSWTGPTGRVLTPGTRFKVHGKRGEWIFLAYVEADPPYVECTQARKKGNVRCIRPEVVYEVSNNKGGEE